MLCCQLESMKPMVELYVTQIDQSMYGNSLHAGYFFMLLMSSADFFQIFFLIPTLF